MKKETAPQRFEGFSPAGLGFLRGLARHNDRAWFAPRKGVYESELLEPLRALVEELSARFARERIPLGGMPQRSIFRIYRDIRFSPDKRPYKTHVSAYLSPDGSRHQPGGLYLHVQPGASFMAAAFHEIEPALLARWRRAIVDDPRRFRTMTRALHKGGLRLPDPDEQDGGLRRLPRGFADAPAEVADYLRLRSFSAHRDLSDADLGSRRLIDAAVRFTKDALPLLRYGWNIEG